MNKKLSVTIMLFSISCGDISILPKNLSCNTLRKQVTMGTDEAIIDFQKQISEIEKDEGKKLKSSSKLNDLYSRLGLKYLEKQMWDPAVSAFTDSIKYGRRNSGTYYSLGLAYAYRGKETNNTEDLDKAESYYRKSIEMEGKNYDTQFALAILLFFERNKKEEAVSIMENIVRNHHSNYLARFSLARFYYELDQPDKSLTIYEELASDLGRLPDSEDIIEYRKQCNENIKRLIWELPAGKKK